MTNTDIEEEYKQANERFNKESEEAFNAPNVHQYMADHAAAYMRLMPYQVAWDKVKPYVLSDFEENDDHHVLLEEMLDDILCGSITDTDGFGKYATETQVSNVIMNFDAMVDSETPEWATHIVWYNK